MLLSYKKVGNNLDLLIILSIAIPIIFLITSIMLLIKLGENSPLIKTMEFYPPKGFNSAEVGFLYKVLQIIKM